jgi:hypothetical protein
MANFNIDYLVVAGGGAGGAGGTNVTGGGGGAGGFLNSSLSSILTTSSLDITVGDGAPALPGTSDLGGSRGSNSIISGSNITTITAIGGGGGGGNNSDSPQASGGSGGGGKESNGTPGSGEPGQGSSGATGSETGNLGGGGGGASQTGQGGNGGNGSSSNITGTAVFYAGGGSANNNNNQAGIGGQGGGGNAPTSGAGQDGAANTGGGGSGAFGNSSGPSGAGGSGIVILRYATADANYTTTGLTPTQTTNGTDTILSFTTVGTGTITFTPPPPPTPFDGTRATTPVTGFNKTGTSEGLKLPSGDNSNQPVGALAEQGMIRNDTEETVDSSASAIAHYNGTAWQYFAATESPDVVYPTSLKMYLDASNTTSYPGTGSTWFDLTSNGNNGTLSTPSWNSNYFHFNGTSDIVTTSGFYGFSVQTWAVWVNPDVLERGEFMQTYPSGTIPQGAMYIEMSNTSGNVEAGVRNSSGSTISVTSTATLTAGAWTHVAVTSDGSNIKIYIGNAAPVSAAATVSSLSTNTQSLVLGYEPRNTRLWFDGKMSKVRVYDTALTQSEINVLVAEGSGA